MMMIPLVLIKSDSSDESRHQRTFPSLLHRAADAEVHTCCHHDSASAMDGDDDSLVVDAGDSPLVRDAENSTKYYPLLSPVARILHQ